MQHRHLNIDSWQVECYFALTGYRNEIIEALRWCGAPDGVITRVQDNMRRNSLDTGFTFSAPHNRRSVMVIGLTSSSAEFVNSFCHELRHLTDDMARERGMALCGEEVAYLCGDIALRLADIVSQLACDHCRTCRR